MAGNHRSGRKHKPTEIKVLEGRFRKDRHGKSPQAEGGFPPAPDGLTEGERLLWDQFPRPVWIALTDRVAVHAAVSVYDRILQVQRLQREAEKPSRLISQESNLWGRLMAILSTLGLTPVDRAKMVTPKGEDVPDKWAGLL